MSKARRGARRKIREPLYRPTDAERRVTAPGKPNDSRDPFRRDLARLLHSPAFRRLQGKTQLFPSDENDFFRNRLTHSLEVAQIATGIASNLNKAVDELKTDPINEHLVHFAALAHDLGHPPFGHNGEKTLDEELKNNGGFEGNAQTLRILARLEKKETELFPLEDVVARPIDEHHNDIRLGLNLTYRSMASVLKYDRQIPATEEECERQGILKRPVKGYYDVERELVNTIKDKVAPGFDGPFKTIECSIMDLADDIAYSTYDVEDAFKAGFLSPIGMAAATAEEKSAIAGEINPKLVDEYGAVGTENPLTVEEIDAVLASVFYELYEGDAAEPKDQYRYSAEIFRRSSVLCENGYFRTDFTSKLVNLFMSGIEFQYRADFPCLSKVNFDIATFKMVEIFKKYAYRSLIMSPRLKIAESRGRDIIKSIFNALMNTEDGRRLLPDDWRTIYFGRDGEPWRRRTVCDFIGSMTDRYCVEFYSRLVGIDAPSIHKPY
jgi:dGTPase